MSATERRNIVVEFAVRPPAGDLKTALDTLRAVLGKMVSLCDVCLLAEVVNVMVTSGAAGTPILFTRCLVDFADAGVDQVRVVARGLNSAAGAVQVAVHDVTNNVELARVAITGVAAQTVAGLWTTITPKGVDHEIEVRIIGNGVDIAGLSRVSLQLRTLRVAP